MSLTQEHLVALSTFLSKYDAKDKLTGLVQYGAMFVADGEAGAAKNIQARFSSARRVFRVLNETNPLKAIVDQPSLGKGPVVLELLEKLRLVSFATYCIGNHVAFIGEVGIIQDKEFTATAGKASLWGWCISSACSAATEAYHAAQLAVARREEEDNDAWALRKVAARKELQRRLFNIAHAMSMVVLALGLLQKIPLRQRTMGALGVFASLVSCYKMYPPVPGLKPKTE